MPHTRPVRARVILGAVVPANSHVQGQAVAQDPSALPALVGVGGTQAARRWVSEAFLWVKGKIDHLPSRFLHDLGAHDLLRETNAHAHEEAAHAVKASALG